MKRIQTIFALLALSSSLTAFAAPEKDAPASAEDLLKKVEAALKAKDKAALLGCFDWQGVSAEIKSMHERFTVEMMLKNPVKTLKLAPLPADQITEFERNGVRYHPNVTIVGVIDFEFATEGTHKSSAQMPYGTKDGHFYLSNTLEERVSQEPAVKEQSLNVSIQGTSSPNPATFEGSYVYLKGGKEVKENIVDEFHRGNASKAFWGDRIKSCTVRKTSADGQIRLMITESGKEVFRSEWETSDKPIVYAPK
ncbi:MAG: hypothetical protein ACXWBP_05455 [Limisphaerales bacterium]